MSEDDHAELKATIAGQSLAIITKDVLPLLLLIVATVGGYLIWLQVDQRLNLLQQHHIRLFDMALEDKKLQRETLETIRNMLQIHDYNQTKPLDQRFPLTLPPASLPKGEAP